MSVLWGILLSDDDDDDDHHHHVTFLWYGIYGQVIKMMIGFGYLLQ